MFYMHKDLSNILQIVAMMSIILISISNGSPLPQSGNYNRPIKTRNRFLDFFKNPSLQSGTPNRQFETGNRLFDLFFLPEIIFFNALSNLFGGRNNRNSRPRPQQSG